MSKKMTKKDIITFSEILKIFEKRSSCIRLQVAALIIKDGRIISTGWNGVPSGNVHCKDYFKDKSIEKHHEFSELYEIHAEANAISFAAKNGISTKGSSLMCSISPCSNCAKIIIASGIKEIFYLNEYDRNSNNKVIEFLKNNGIKVEKV
jgi:dCMP deaminase